jgi:hypothetical protein
MTYLLMRNAYPVNMFSESAPVELQRAGWFTAALLVVSIVGDGWSGRPSPLTHQLLLLPFTALFLLSLALLLFPSASRQTTVWTAQRGFALALAFELLFVAVYAYEVRHFADVGYRPRINLATGLLTPALAALAMVLVRRLTAVWALAATMFAYLAGMTLSIISFPMNYLRSDMLPVILWADQALLRHTDPYITMHVADRLYDFPYLPGMMVAFYPFVAAHVDIRFGCVAYNLALGALVWFASRPDRRMYTTALLALFLLCPFLQYRHELYLQPHWFAMMLAFVLMQRRRFVWAALAFGVGMAIYQFSWILFPFFLLNALRRRGWLETLKLTAVAAVGTLIVVGPFLRSASKRIASNTVGQWGHLSAHAMAEPINLSYWATYIVRVDQLLKVQAALMVVIFLYAFVRGRCADLADTLRWMTLAVTIFVLMNSIVDGYFYLMLLVIMLAYTCVANGWWADPLPPAVVQGA